MTIAFAMLLLGSLLVYCGWNKLSVRDALRGNNTVAKAPVAVK